MSPFIILHPESDAEVENATEDKTCKTAEISDNGTKKYAAMWDVDTQIALAVPAYQYVEKAWMDFSALLTVWGASGHGKLLVTCFSTTELVADQVAWDKAGVECRGVGIIDGINLNVLQRTRIELPVYGDDADVYERLFGGTNYGQTKKTGLRIESNGVNKFGTGYICTSKFDAVHHRPVLVLKTKRGWHKEIG